MNRYLTTATVMPSYVILPRALLRLDLGNTELSAYMLLLDRARISFQNRGWRDGEGRAFLYYPVQALARDLRRSETAVKTALRRLEEKDLILRKRQGQGRPNRIYVKLPEEESWAPAPEGPEASPEEESRAPFAEGPEASPEESGIPAPERWGDTGQGGGSLPPEEPGSAPSGGEETRTPGGKESAPQIKTREKKRGRKSKGAKAPSAAFPALPERARKRLCIPCRGGPGGARRFTPPGDSKRTPPWC